MEIKKILGDFNYTMNKMDRDAGNKTQRLYRCGSNYVLSNFIVDNGLEDLLRREFTHHNRSSGSRSMIDRIYTDTKIDNSTKINHIMVSFTDHYHGISLDRLPSKTKIGKD